MINTASDLLTQFHAVAAYTQSDEITLVFPPPMPAEAETKHPAELMFNGRVMKIATLAASFCSVRFNYYLTQASFGETETKLASKVRDCHAHFDGRVFNVDSDAECLNNILWRCRDVKRNSKAAWGRKFFSTKQLQNLTSDEIVAKVERECNRNWNDEPGFYKFGVIIKRALVTKPAHDPRTGANVTAARTVNYYASWDISYTEAAVRALVAKYCNEDIADPRFASLFKEQWV
eukprot:TRINITY_DN2050_c0_g1_i6.p1 TRINITY_DN2050_c0_g1~~TRINITY_DN2050_c0_g1_i6.p1  ORF type:complete len:233 (-),score=51.92 TRINITY_DN2050_c0_g1_i6:741-1439(-)